MPNVERWKTLARLITSFVNERLQLWVGFMCVSTPSWSKQNFKGKSVQEKQEGVFSCMDHMRTRFSQTKDMAFLEDSYHVPDPSEGPGHCSQVTKEPVVGTCLTLPFGSWCALLGKQMSVSWDSKRETGTPTPCSPGTWNLQEQTLTSADSHVSAHRSRSV